MCVHLTICKVSSQRFIHYNMIDEILLGSKFRFGVLRINSFHCSIFWHSTVAMLLILFHHFLVMIIIMICEVQCTIIYIVEYKTLWELKNLYSTDYFCIVVEFCYHENTVLCCFKIYCDLWGETWLNYAW